MGKNPETHESASRTGETIRKEHDSQELTAGHNNMSSNPKRGNEPARRNDKNQYRNEGLTGR